MKVLVAAIAAALAAAPTPALAQQDRTSAPDAKTAQLMQTFAACVAERRDRLSRNLLALDFRTAEYRRALNSLVNSRHGCLRDGRLRFARLAFVGGVAEYLLERDLAGGSLAAGLKLDPQRPLKARDEGEMAGLCTAAKAPAEVERLLKTEAGTSGESLAVRELQPAFASCVASGASARINDLGLRALLALAAYRISAHNAPTQLSGN